MISITEIEREKETAVENAESVLFEIIARENNSSEPETGKWSQARVELEDKINELNAQTFERALDEAQAALDALGQVSRELQTTASRMRSATEFLNALNGVLGAADTALNALRRSPMN